MTTTPRGGIFGLNPFYNNLAVNAFESNGMQINGDGRVTGTLTVDGSIIVDGMSLGGLSLQGVWDAGTNVPDLVSITPQNNQFWIVREPGNTQLGEITDWAVNDWAVYINNEWTKIAAGDSSAYSTLDIGNMTLTGSSITVNAPSTDLTLTPRGTGNLIVQAPVRTASLGGIGNGSLDLLSGGTSTMFLSANSLCGINVSTPLSALHVKGTINSVPGDSGVHMGEVTGGQTGILISASQTSWLAFHDTQDTQSFKGRISYSHSTHTMTFQANEAASFNISQTGAVVTGGLSVTNNLSVSLNATVGTLSVGNHASAGSIGTSGAITAGSILVGASAHTPNGLLDVTGSLAITNDVNTQKFFKMSASNEQLTQLFIVSPDDEQRWSINTFGQMTLLGSGWNYSTAHDGFSFGYTTTTGIATISSQHPTLGSDIVFRTNAAGANSVERMRITDTGAVGIRVVNAAYTLDLGSIETDNGYSLRLRSNAQARTARIQFTTSTGSQNGFIGVSDDQHLSFGTAENEVFRILRDGSFLLGIKANDDSDRMLIVNKDEDDKDTIATFISGAPESNNTVNNTGFKLTAKGKSLTGVDVSQTCEIMVEGRTGNGGATLVFKTDNILGNMIERARFNSGGAFLVNTVSQFNGAPFNIATGGLGIGNSNLQGEYRRMHFDGAHNLVFTNGTNSPQLTSAGQWSTASDLIFKRDITDIGYGLNTLNKLKPRSYYMKSHETNDSPHIGFIAQEMKEFIPECVFGEEGEMSISYGNLTAVLVSAIQELSQKVERLEKETY